MIQIGDTLVSFDLFEKKFYCDLAVCKGNCCVDGDSGAPLEDGEMEQIEKNYPAIREYMKPSGVATIEEQGYGGRDLDGDTVTPLINGVECAYTIDENGSCWCAIEKAWSRGESSFRKPISCHLYPARIKKYPGFEVINYHKWKICHCAVLKGERETMPLYRFLKDALIAKYGIDWYSQLEYAAKEIEEGRIEIF